MSLVNWEDVPGGQKQGNGVNFLRLSSASVHMVRPVHKASRIYKYFYQPKGEKLRTAICADPNTCEVRQKHPELDAPSERYVFRVIDRADGKLKILEVPRTVFLSINSWAQGAKKDPGSSNGGDFQIKIEGKGKFGTKYNTTFIQATPFTNDEKKMIKELFEQTNVEELFKADSPEDIEKKLFGLEQEKSSDSDDDFTGSNDTEEIEIDF